MNNATFERKIKARKDLVIVLSMRSSKQLLVGLEEAGVTPPANATHSELVQTLASYTVGRMTF